MICLEPSKGLINGRKINLTTDANNYAFEDSGKTLICGHGGGDTIRGGNGDDVIEASGTIASNINGGNGVDRLIGSEGDDIIRGGNGDDILIGLGGNDTLQGGAGKNLFITGIDDESISCNHDEVIGTEDSYNIVFFKEDNENYTLSQPCNKAECRVIKNNTSNTKVTNIILGDTLVFADRVINLEQGEEGNFLPMDREACNTEVITLEPPVQEENPENDPRWIPLLEAARIGFSVVNAIAETYTQQNRQLFINEWNNNVRAHIRELPFDVKDRFCFYPRIDDFQRRDRSTGQVITFYIGKFIFTPKINNRCVWMGIPGHGMVSTARIRPDTTFIRKSGSLAIPDEGTSYRSCNIHSRRLSSGRTDGHFIEARDANFYR